MRIVAGIYGGRCLNVPKGQDIRPTSDKVRGAIFNTLVGYIDFQGAQVLDAFCGTGALGLEALSRGAEHCTFIDKARASLDLAKGNAADLGAEGASTFKIGNASKVSLSGDYSLLFFDPPYAKGLVQQALDNLRSVMADEAICVVESEKTLDFNPDKGFELLKEKIYGDTKVLYLRYMKSVA